jgi:hypothetical protein
MTRLLVSALVLTLLAGRGTLTRAQDAKSVLDKALKAVGGEKKLAEVKAVNWKGKGTLTFNGEDYAFTLETTLAGLDHMRATFESNIMGNEIKVTTVVAGDNGWRVFADQKMELDKESLLNEKRTMYLQLIPATLVPLRQKEFKVELVGMEKVADKPATVLKVTGPDKKDFTLYFDQETGLPVKQVANVLGLMGEEYTQEQTYGGYKDFEGVKKATKIDSKRDGEKFISYEITDFQVLKSVDAGTFKEPD